MLQKKCTKVEYIRVIIYICLLKCQSLCEFFNGNPNTTTTSYFLSVFPGQERSGSSKLLLCKILQKAIKSPINPPRPNWTVERERGGEQAQTSICLIIQPNQQPHIEANESQSVASSCIEPDSECQGNSRGRGTSPAPLSPVTSLYSDSAD